MTVVSNSWWQDGYTKADAVLKKLQAVLDELAIKEGHRLADGNMRGLGLANSEQHHASRPTALQSMFNMLWAMQQLTALSSAEQRRGMLMEMSSSAPFSIPVMRVVSFSTFKDLGRFPDDASASGDENKSQTVSTLPIVLMVK